MKRSGCLFVDEEFEGSDVRVVACLSEANCRIGERGAGFRKQSRRRGDLDDLLLAALHAAIAVTEVNDAARAVPDNLHLDMACVVQIRLDVHVRLTERGFSLRAAACPGLLEC